MSLIQEALKRQQAEFGDGASDSSPAATNNITPPPEPPAPPAPPAPPKPDRSPRTSVPLPEEPLSAGAKSALATSPTPRRALPQIIAVLAFLVVFLAAAVWLGVFAWQYYSKAGKPKARTTLADKTKPSTIAEQPLKISEAGSEPEAAAGAAAMPEAPAAPAATAASTALLAPETVAAESVPTPIPPLESAALITPDPPESQPKASKPSPSLLTQATKPPAPAPKAAPVLWPKLHLTGVLCSSVPDEGAARINNTMVFAGSQIEGATLLKIQNDGVLLSYQDERRFLRVGSTLY